MLVLLVLLAVLNAVKAWMPVPLSSSVSFSVAAQSHISKVPEFTSMWLSELTSETKFEAQFQPEQASLSLSILIFFLIVQLRLNKANGLLDDMKVQQDKVTKMSQALDVKQLDGRATPADDEELRNARSELKALEDRQQALRTAFTFGETVVRFRAPRSTTRVTQEDDTPPVPKSVFLDVDEQQVQRQNSTKELVAVFFSVLSVLALVSVFSLLAKDPISPERMESITRYVEENGARP